jgi:hypothetical protein
MHRPQVIYDIQIEIRDFLIGVCDHPRYLFECQRKIEKIGAHVCHLDQVKLADQLKQLLNQHVTRVISLYSDGSRFQISQQKFDQPSSFVQPNLWHAKLQKCWQQHVDLLVLHARAHLDGNWHQEALIWNMNAKTSEELAYEITCWLEDQILEQSVA